MKKVSVILAIAAIVASTSSPAFAGEWKNNVSGYWYQNDDGSNPAASWQNIDGKWYYFKPDGYMNIHWIKVSDKWYYCELSGEMRTEELVTDVFTFRFNEDGSCQNFYENTTPSTQAGWATYGTSSLSTLADDLVNGNVVYYGGTYWATPDYTNMLENALYSYRQTTAPDNEQNTTSYDRYALADLELDLPDNDDEVLDLDGISAN